MEEIIEIERKHGKTTDFNEVYKCELKGYLEAGWKVLAPEIKTKPKLNKEVD